VGQQAVEVHVFLNVVRLIALALEAAAQLGGSAGVTATVRTIRRRRAIAARQGRSELPDSPNHPKFPNTVLRPGARFRSITVCRFGAR
jgi:galactose mutarotase-like enzyme